MADSIFQHVWIFRASKEDLDQVDGLYSKGPGKPSSLPLVEANGPGSRATW